MWHKPCRTFHPWCPCIKTRCLLFDFVNKKHQMNPVFTMSFSPSVLHFSFDYGWVLHLQQAWPNTCQASKMLHMHYCDVKMGTVASEITNLAIVYSSVYSDADQRKHQSSASLAFVLGIHRGPVNSPHKWPVTWKMFPLDNVIMAYIIITWSV